MIPLGLVVEFIEGNRFIIAVCIDHKKDKPRLLTQSGKEVVMQPRRLVSTTGPTLSTSLSRDEFQAKLNELTAKREELAAQVDLEELWELLDGEEESPDTRLLAELAFGEPIDPDQETAVIRAILTDKVFFKFHPEGITITPPAKVEQLQVQRRREQELAREMEQAGQWLAAVWEDREAPEPESKNQVVARLIDVALNGPDSSQAAKVRGYLSAAGIKRSKAPFRLLVKLGEFEPDEDLDLRRFEIPQNFPPEVLEEAEKMADTAIESMDWSDYRDLTDLPTITIDGSGTKDFDDALSLIETDEDLTVYIHITDITPFIDPGSALDLEARARAASIYLPDRRLPMLPEPLSEGLLSLREGEIKPAITVQATLKDDGQILSRQVFRSLIRVDERLVYSEVDRDLNPNHKLYRFSKLAERLTRNRIEAGALIIEVPEILIFPGEEGVEINRIEGQTLSRRLVAEMMILANRVLAEKLAQAKIPVPFRCQDPLKGDFEGHEGADPLWVNLRQRMLFSRLEILPEPGPHCGLGLDAYVTFTSPIRRYYDLITIRQIHALLDGTKPLYDRAELEDMITALAPQLRSHNQLRFRRQRYWLLKYLAQDMDKPLEAVVLRQTRDRYSLVLLETMLRVSSPKLPPGTLVEGERIMVKIAQIDPLDDILRIELIEDVE